MSRLRTTVSLRNDHSESPEYMIVEATARASADIEDVLHWDLVAGRTPRDMPMFSRPRRQEVRHGLEGPRLILQRVTVGE